MRLADVDDYVQDIGSIIEDESTSLVTDHGVEVREIPVERKRCGSSTWISKDGYAVQRHYNPWTESWTWGEQKNVSLANDEMMLNIGSGRYIQTVRLVRAIALAWLTYPKSSLKYYSRIVSAGDIVADNIGWIRLGVKCVKNIRDVEDIPVHLMGNEEWAPLVILRFDENGDKFQDTTHDTIKISNFGILEIDGEYMRGYVSAYQRHYFCINKIGIVWVDDAVMNSFRESSPIPGRMYVEHIDGNTLNDCVSNLQWAEKKETRVMQKALEIYEWSMNGFSKEEIMRQMSISDATYYNELLVSAANLPLRVIRDKFWTTVVDTEILKEIDRLYGQQNPLLGDTLTKLNEYLITRNQYIGEMSESTRFAQMKIAREYAYRKWLSQ